MPPLVSVVLPTHNRWPHLHQVLEGYARLAEPPGAFEVIVCDDASTDATPRELVAFAVHAPYPLQVLRQDKSGPAAARNRGIAAATGAIVLLTDDDCVPDEQLIARHRATTRRGVATIGLIAWHPDLTLTPFMRFLAPGYRFNYGQIADPENATYRCFYTANVSATRADLLAVGGFDERFPAAAYEDIDLGYRLHQQGVRFIFDERAVIHHLHEMTLAGSMRRQQRDGGDAAYLLRKHPELLIEAYVVTLRDPATAARAFGAALKQAHAAGATGERGAGEEDWIVAIAEGESLPELTPSTAEEHFFTANAHAHALEDRLLALEDEHQRLADMVEDAGRRLQQANPLKNRLRHLLRQH